MSQQDNSYYKIYAEALKWDSFDLIGIIVQHIFELYVNVFLLYLVVRFARENKNAETKDPILDRNVPSIVSLRN